MKICLVVWCFFCAFCSEAATGVLQTANGLSFHGDIRASDGQLNVFQTNGRCTTVDLKNVSRLKMVQKETPPELEGKVHGLTATYFNSKDLTGQRVTRIDPAIDFDWQEKPPIDVNSGDSFSIRWEGEIEAPLSESYTFYIQGNDQMKLWVNSKLVIEGEGGSTTGENTGGIRLEGGKRYAFKLEFYEKNWSASAKLFWSSPSIPKTLVASDFLYTTAPMDNSSGLQNNGLLGVYFSRPNLSGDYKMRVDPSLDFDWEESPPIPGLEANQYSVRWEGDLVPEISEAFTLEMETEECVRLYLDEKLILQSCKESQGDLTSAPVDLKAGVKYHLRIELVDAGARAGMRLVWSSASISRSVIPANFFIPAKPPPFPTAKAKLPAGVVLTDGSVLAISVQAADLSSVSGSNQARKAYSLSTVQVARILLQPFPTDLEEKLKSGRPGLLLSNKDFVDGDLKELANGNIQVSSILYGLKTFERGKVIAIVIRDTQKSPRPAAYTVKTQDGSTLKAGALQVETDSLLLNQPALAEYRVPMENLLEIEAGK